MTSSDSDSDGVFQRVDSTSTKLYSEVPEEIVFKMKIKPLGDKTLKLRYTLKKEQKLPYEPDLDGMFFHFYHLRFHCSF